MRRDERGIRDARAERGEKKRSSERRDSVRILYTRSAPLHGRESDEGISTCVPVIASDPRDIPPGRGGAGGLSADNAENAT